MVLPSSLVTFLLDRSGSMEACKAATIEGFNGYLATLQAEEAARIDFTFLQFAGATIDKIHVAVPVAEALPLTPASYRPGDRTPLVDAAVMTIKAVAASLSARSDSPRVVICIQTDGHENASIQYDWAHLSALIRAKQQAGWAFNFLGAGINAYEQAAKMGIADVNAMSYRFDDRMASGSAFKAAAEVATDFAAFRADVPHFSERHRLKAKDDFVPASLGTGFARLLRDLAPKRTGAAAPDAGKAPEQAVAELSL